MSFRALIGQKLAGAAHLMLWPLTVLIGFALLPVHRRGEFFGKGDTLYFLNGYALLLALVFYLSLRMRRGAITLSLIILGAFHFVLAVIFDFFRSPRIFEIAMIAIAALCPTLLWLGLRRLRQIARE